MESCLQCLAANHQMESQIYVANVHGNIQMRTACLQCRPITSGLVKIFSCAHHRTPKRTAHCDPETKND